MLPRCRVGRLWGSSTRLYDKLVKVCLQDARLVDFRKIQLHNIAKVCLQDASLGDSWEMQPHNIVKVCSQDAKLEDFGEVPHDVMIKLWDSNAYDIQTQSRLFFLKTCKN